MAIKKGDNVRQIVTPIEGVAESFSVDQETGQVLIMVKWIDSDGVEHSKFFTADEIEAVA